MFVKQEHCPCVHLCPLFLPWHCLSLLQYLPVSKHLFLLQKLPAGQSWLVDTHPHLPWTHPYPYRLFKQSDLATQASGWYSSWHAPDKHFWMLGHSKSEEHFLERLISTSPKNNTSFVNINILISNFLLCVLVNMDRLWWQWVSASLVGKFGLMLINYLVVANFNQCFKVMGFIGW